jgi:hypothetical protein
MKIKYLKTPLLSFITLLIICIINFSCYNTDNGKINTTITKKENNSILLEINNKSNVELNIIIPKNKFLCHNFINNTDPKYQNYTVINLKGKDDIYEVEEGRGNLIKQEIDNLYEVILIKPKQSYKDYFFIPSKNSPCSYYHKINDKYIGVYLFNDSIISKSNLINFYD